MSAPMDEQRLAEILARANAATAGPWRWSGNTEVRDMRLQAQHHGGLTVMDFVRWGMQDARPRFAKDYCMHPADEMVEYQVHQLGWVDKSEPPYRADISGIDHPDARFIAAAREDVPALVAEVQRLRAERHSTNEALSDAAEQLRVQRDRIAELEAQLPYREVWSSELAPGGFVCSVCGQPVESEPCPDHAPKPERQQEDPHTSPLHQTFALGRDDLQFSAAEIAQWQARHGVVPQQTTGLCPRCRHLFEDCTCGGGF